MNKLIRQYFPKCIDLKEIPDEKIQTVELVLHHRSRRILGFINPAISKPTESEDSLARNEPAEFKRRW